MTRFREKKDPARTLTWLSSLTFEENDKIYVQAVSGVSGMVGERIAEWSTDQLQDTLSTDEWVEVLQRMAQDHCDATQARGTYRLVHERGDAQRSFFLLRLEPATSKSADGGLDGDEDPSVEGQLRSLMAHQRMTMSMALKTPMMVIEMLMKQLAMSNERIAELERERADHLDTYATALELAATAETKQNQSVPEQVEAWTKVVPELAKSVPLLVSGIKAIVKL